jgi:hypothetical protein
MHRVVAVGRSSRAWLVRGVACASEHARDRARAGVRVDSGLVVHGALPCARLPRAGAAIAVEQVLELSGLVDFLGTYHERQDEYAHEPAYGHDRLSSRLPTTRPTTSLQ